MEPVLYDVGDFDGVWAPHHLLGGRWWLYVDARDEALHRNVLAGVMDENGNTLPCLARLEGQARYITYHLGHPECTCRSRGG